MSLRESLERKTVKELRLLLRGYLIQKNDDATDECDDIAAFTILAELCTREGEQDGVSGPEGLGRLLRQFQVHQD